MSTSVHHYDAEIQDFSFFGAENLRASREPLDAFGIVHAGATRMLANGSLPSGIKSRLNNLRQSTRHGAANRSAFGALLDAAPFCRPADALFWLELTRAEILGRSAFAVPATSAAHESESHANHVADIAQITHRESRTRGTLEQLVDALQVQAIASRVLADAEAKEMRVRSRIMLASR